jgi:F0F1-type ATP synthase delta subunit
MCACVQSIMKENPSVRDFLTNPVIPEDKRKALLKSLAKEVGLTEVTVNFISLLMDNDRLLASTEIFEAFEKQYCSLTDTQV